jgi:hypothetical protein
MLSKLTYKSLKYKFQSRKIASKLFLLKIDSETFLQIDINFISFNIKNKKVYF